MLRTLTEAKLNSGIVFDIFFCYLKVSQLILLNEAAQKEGVPLPDLVPSAQQIRQAVESLVLAGQKLVSETPDNVTMFYSNN